MTATVAPASAAWTAASVTSTRGLPARLVAGGLHVAAGLTMTSIVIGVAVAQSIIARGVVVADANDVALLRAVAPVALLFGLLGVATVVTGLGIVFGSRQAAALGIGLGLFDLVAGVVGLAIAAGSTGDSGSGVGISMTLVGLGIALAVSARIADVQTHGPSEPAEAQLEAAAA